MTSETITQWWPLITAFLAFVAWLLRLEATVKKNAEEIKRVEASLKSQRTEDLEERRLDFDRLYESIVIVQQDIKKLIKEENRHD